MRRVATAVYWLSLSVWLGSIVCFTFITAPKLVVAVPSAFGDAVGAIFPTYFALGAVASVLSLFAGWWALPTRPNIWTRRRRTAPWIHRVSLMGLTLATWSAALWAYPKTVAAAPEQFGKWHGITMALNLLALSFAVIALLVRTLAGDAVAGGTRKGA